jgi:Zn-dependent protease with chaperone function
MNFFKRQDQARRQTALLVIYLLVAVVLIVVAVNAVIYAAVVFSSTPPPDFSRWMTLPWWPVISLATVLVILGGSLVRFLRLRGGGRAVAEMMGARRLDTNTREPMERRFANVVEEMSIASGTPVPDLYVMDQEDGINAFVAGYQPTQAVMVTTRGALETLSRDELQGVVAHEFSHILNGDMRLNVRLMAILAGILVLGIIGRLMMRSLYGRSRYGRASGGSRSGKTGGIVVVVGLGLFLIGYIGLFFGRLIKAAVSRQREFLADASSVQFTRLPGGIAGALWKIKQHARGSLLSSDGAEETSHMCFGQNMRFGFTNLLATHPPLDERIKRIDPYFHAKVAAQRFKEPSPEAAAAVPGADAAVGFAAGGDAAPAEAVRVVASVGNPSGAHVEYAERLFGAIPAALLESVHDPVTAPAVIYGLLLGDVAEERVRLARALIEHETTPDTEARIANIREGLEDLDVRFRLPLLDIAVPTLRGLSEEDRQKLMNVCEKLVRIDRKVTLFEFVLLTLLKKHLGQAYPPDVKIKYKRFDAVLPEIRVLLTLMARTGARDDAQAQKSFARAMGSFTRIDLSPADEAYCNLEAIGEVLTKLAALSPLLKVPLLSACADCVLHDGAITTAEAELLRAVSEALDCPMPPLLAQS